ncbi:MAG: IclR family transcriptional regulator [Spirochaetota bacterium]
MSASKFDDYNKKKLVNSLVRAIRILEAFNQNEKMGITGISKKLNLPKSTTHMIVNTLVHEGILEKDINTNYYQLGLKLFELGNRARSNLEVRKVATPYLKDLNEFFDETVHLTILDNYEVLYVECFESTKRLRTYSVIGVRAPLHCTAVGKAIMAFLPDEEIVKVIEEKGLQRFTQNTITEKELLVKELQKIRKIGYAVDNMEHEEGVRCVGAPLWNHTGNVFASISVSGPSQRLGNEKIPDIAKKVMSVANEISRKMGFKG